jgi:hypothetical protein
MIGGSRASTPKSSPGLRSGALGITHQTSPQHQSSVQSSRTQREDTHVAAGNSAPVGPHHVIRWPAHGSRYHSAMARLRPLPTTVACSVIVRGLCFGHALGEYQGCLINAAANIASACNSGRRAATWYEGCFLSYADTNASTGYDEGYRYELRNRYFVSDKTAFEKTYEALMSRLIARAVNGSSEPTSSPVPMFATGHAVFDSQTTHNGTMYGLVQCMRDRSAAECGKCLQDSVRQLPRCCYGKGRVSYLSLLVLCIIVHFF